MEVVADAYDVTEEDILSRRRFARLATARAAACYLLRKHFAMSTTEVGRMVRRTHAAVIMSCRKVEGFFRWPKMYSNDIAIIKLIEKTYFKDEKMDKVGD